MRSAWIILRPDISPGSNNQKLRRLNARYQSISGASHNPAYCTFTGNFHQLILELRILLGNLAGLHAAKNPRTWYQFARLITSSSIGGS